MNDRLLDAYRHFLDLRAAISMKVTPDRIAKYDWYILPDELSPVWIIYSRMLAEHCLGIANSINQLLEYINSLEAWRDIIKDNDGSHKWEIIVEFVTPVATLAIIMPYVVRSRFIYSLVHLCHQCNRIKDDKWIDELPAEDEIHDNAADKYCSQWKNRYWKLKVALDKIANKKYGKDTKDFRHKYNHRYSLGIELGMTELVKRIVIKGMVRYKVGGTTPLKIDEVLPILKTQHANCLKAFEKYQNLISEQILAIGKY